MTLTELRAFTRFLTNTNSSTYTDADLDANIATYNELFTTEILDSMDEWDFSAETATTDLITSQQEYILPNDILKIKRVEVTYDGTSWYLASPMDVNERISATDDTSVLNDFSVNNPYFDLMDNSLVLYPAPTQGVTAGLKVWYEQLPVALSANSSPNFAQPFHKGLSYGAAKDYFDKYLGTEANSTKSQMAANNLETYIQRAKVFYRKHNQDRKYTVEGQFVDYGYGNN